MDIVDVQTIWQCGMKNVSVSTDGGKTWKAIADKVGGMGCILAFADSKTGWFGFGNKFQMTTDGGATWKEPALPEAVSKVAAISLRTPTDGYLVDEKGVLYITQDGGKTWSSQSLGLDNPSIMGFASGPFINETPQAAVRFIDANHGLVVLGLSGKTGMVALRTADGGKTWKEESLPAKFGTPYISHDGRFLTVNKWGEGITLLKYE
ncbi:MAG TPA: YCF48-related protein [Desulfatiglandales bacterium]|nr:YCF48-related protein [Desulfatiglandales bacterium]